MKTDFIQIASYASKALPGHTAFGSFILRGQYYYEFSPNLKQVVN